MHIEVDITHKTKVHNSFKFNLLLLGMPMFHWIFLNMSEHLTPFDPMLFQKIH